MDQTLADLDPRINAYRPDLADIALKGRVDAEAYAEGRHARVAAGRLPLMIRPDGDSRMGSELLFGESVTIFETCGGWAWLQNREDGYVGYARAEGLGEAGEAPTHGVSALRTVLYAEPDLKSRVLDILSMNSLLRARERENGFIGLAAGGWVWAAHAEPLDAHESDHAAVALRFLGAPYLWGGRSSIGLDCSGLVQMALARCGKRAPRDSDMQAAAVGDPVDFDGDVAALRHGDLVFWPGHVGVWLEGGDFVHANAADMAVTRGPFERIARQTPDATGSGVIEVRRP